MPTYEYRCDACGHELEAFQSITAKPLKKCPECGKNKLTRLIGTGAGIIFKGSGFYETDYRSEGYKEAAKAEKDAAKPKSETKSKSDAQGGNGKPSPTDGGAEKTKSADRSPEAKKSSKPKKGRITPEVQQMTG